jgi:hypothetical protein
MRLVSAVALAALIAAGIAAGLSVPEVSAPAPAIDSSLRAVACPSPGRCLAVGLTGSKYTVRVPLTARSEDGPWIAWSSDAAGSSDASLTRDRELSAIACVSFAECVAVGRQEVPAPYFGARSAGDRPLTAVWDGTTWRSQDAVVPPGTADSDLQGVACASSMCMGVGTYAKRLGEDRALAVSWDGSAWRLDVPPTPRSADGPAEAVLSDVACVSTTSCIAVGKFTFELEGLMGTVVAPLIERWDGTRWRIERAPNPGSTDAELYAISCDPTGGCVAVGSQRLRQRTYAALAMRWTGTAWRLLPTPRPTHASSAELLDVSCPRPHRCTGVGYEASGTGIRALAGSWDGRRWTIEPISTPASFTSSALNSVDCALPTSCQAVGTYERGSPILHAFTAKLADGVWEIHPVPET